jgi:glycosyltransferase involved in cell wall biosynthesis
MTVDAVGGVWSYATALAAALVPRGFRTTLAVIGPSPSAAQRDAQPPGIDLVETGQPLDWLAESEEEVRQSAETVAALASACGADLVQLNSPALAGFVRFAVPVIGLCHSCLATWWDAVRGGSMPSDFAWRTEALRRGYAACDALVAPSAAFAAATARVHALPSAPEVVLNGCAPAPLGTGAADRVFTAGRLWDAGKDLATLDRAAPRIALPVEAAGPVRGPHGEQVSLPHLHLLGTLDAAAIRRRLATRPIFVSTARYEPFGLAVLEAAQAGCPLVLTDIPTFRELWDGAAVFAAPGDDVAIAHALNAISRDREQGRWLGVAAARRARRLTADRMADGMAAIAARLLEGRAAHEGRSAAA